MHTALSSSCHSLLLHRRVLRSSIPLSGFFLCYIKSARICTPVGMLLLPLGDHYRVWQLSLTFSSISRCLTKLQTFNKKYTLPSLAHTDGRTKAHSWKKPHGLSYCKPCASAAHVEPSIPFSHCSPSCFGSHGCDFQCVRSSFSKVLCLAISRPQDCVWFRTGMEAVFMRLTISFQMGCSLHVTNCWGLRLLCPAEESLYFSLQTEIGWKV